MSPNLSCAVCGGSGWIEDLDTRQPVRKCTACSRAPSAVVRIAETPAGERLNLAVRDRASAAGEFAVEDVVAAAFGDEMSFGNVTGAVTAALSREGVIRRVGSRPARRATRAGAWVALWVGRGDPRFRGRDGS